MNAARLARRWSEAHGDNLAMAEALADELEGGLATTQDLAAAVGELRAEIQRARADTVKWVAGLLLVHAFGVAGLTVGLIRLL